MAARIRTDGFVDPCIRSRAPKPPSGPDWVHEVKHDGYRLIVSGRTARLARAPAVVRNTAHNAFRRPDGQSPLKPSIPVENKMNDFLRRFLMHYGIYRRYPLGRLPALRNAWRTARP